MNTPITTQKKMYKVISPIEKRGGGTYWMRVGSAFTNRDDSINLYLDAMPAPNGKSFQLQIRELTEEDLRRRDTHRDGSGHTSSANDNGSAGYGGGANGDGFAASSAYGRDLGGIGGGPSSRAVTSGGARSGEDVPF